VTTYRSKNADDVSVIDMKAEQARAKQLKILKAKRMSKDVPSSVAID